MKSNSDLDFGFDLTIRILLSIDTLKCMRGFEFIDRSAYESK
jgi:hypothetical protein